MSARVELARRVLQMLKDGQPGRLLANAPLLERIAEDPSCAM
jgi:hypothetical protein